MINNSISKLFNNIRNHFLANKYQLITFLYIIKEEFKL